MDIDPDDIAFLRAKWDQADAMVKDVEARGTPCPNSRTILDFVALMLDEETEETAA